MRKKFLSQLPTWLVTPPACCSPIPLFPCQKKVASNPLSLSLSELEKLGNAWCDKWRSAFLLFFITKYLRYDNMYSSYTYTGNIFPICDSSSCYCQYLCLYGTGQDWGETAYSESANKSGELGTRRLRLPPSCVFLFCLFSLTGSHVVFGKCRDGI